MKSTGIVRKVDELGRVVLPKEIRKILGLGSQVPIEFYTENDTVIIKKYTPNCIFCGSENRLVSYEDRPICKECQKKISKLKNAK